jgi:hypothetical protein
MQSYSPVQYVYREIITEQMEKNSDGKIFYFDNDDKVESTEGKVRALEDVTGKGMYITLDTGAQIRIDRIITLFGKPGAAFDEYDSFANQCLACTGGYDIDKLD